MASLAILRGWPILAAALDTPDADDTTVKLNTVNCFFISIVEIGVYTN